MKRFLKWNILFLLLSSNAMAFNFYGGNQGYSNSGGQVGLSQEFYCDGLQMPCDDQYGNLFRLTPYGAQLGIPGLAGINLRASQPYGYSPSTPNLWGQCGYVNPAFSMIPFAGDYMPRFGCGTGYNNSSSGFRISTSITSRSGGGSSKSRSSSSGSRGSSSKKERSKDKSKKPLVAIPVQPRGETVNDTDGVGPGSSKPNLQIYEFDPKLNKMMAIPVQERCVTVLDIAAGDVKFSEFLRDCKCNKFENLNSPRCYRDIASDGGSKKPNKDISGGKNDDGMGPLIAIVPEDDNMCKYTPSQMMALKSSEGEFCPECIDTIKSHFNKGKSIREFNKDLACKAEGSPGAYYKKLYTGVPEPCIENIGDAKLYTCVAKSLSMSAPISKVITPSGDGKSCKEISSNGEQGSCGSEGVLNATFSSFKTASKCLNIPMKTLFKVIHHESRFNLNAILRYDGDPNYGEAGLGQSVPEAVLDMSGKSKWANTKKCNQLKKSLSSYVSKLEIKKSRKPTKNATKQYQCNLVSSVSSAGKTIAAIEVASDPILKQSLIAASVLSYNRNHYQDSAYRRPKSKSICAEDYKGLSTTQKDDVRDSLAMLGYNRGAGTAMIEFCSYLKYVKSKGQRFDTSLVNANKSKGSGNNKVTGFVSYLKNDLQKPTNTQNWLPILSKRIRGSVRAAIQASDKPKDEKERMIQLVNAIKKFDINGLPRMAVSTDRKFIQSLFKKRLKSYTNQSNEYLERIANDNKDMGQECKM